MASVSKERTMGDGMDNTLIALTDTAKENIPFQLKLRSSEAILNAMTPIEPRGKLIVTIPKYVPKEIKQPKYLTAKPKEPKFVPYEPFKGAVAPIVPSKRQPTMKPKDYPEPKNKNNIDIHELVAQMSEIRSSEMRKKSEFDSLGVGEDPEAISRRRWEKERRGFETDIKNLRETNSHLENQLKFQAQVNGELKTLLVAAVGEDLESRVQHLTEDKLQLARLLLNSANRLTSHQEQTEWLSGQCEVWRSKFLASSLMVEELARWKSVLSQRIIDLQENLKLLIEERTKVRKASIKCLNNLKHINDDHCKLEGPSLRSSNIIDLAAVNCRLSENIARHLSRNSYYSENVEYITNLRSNTPGEIKSIHLLKNPVTLLSKPDALCNAVMGAAMSMGSGQMYLQHPFLQTTCCSHCKGEVQDI